MLLICPGCGHTVQPNSAFCSICGTRIPAPPVQSPVETQRPVSNGKLFPILTICLSIFVVVLAVFGFSQYNQKQEMEQAVHAVGLSAEDLEASLAKLQNDNRLLKDELNRMEQTIVSDETTIANQQQQIDMLEKDVNTYHILTDFLQQTDAGYADTSFHAVRPVYVMHVDDPAATFTLTAKLNGGTIYYATSGNSAIVSPTEETFYSTTPMQIDPVREGITYISFTNSKNDLAFRVMVLIIP